MYSLGLELRAGRGASTSPNSGGSSGFSMSSLWANGEIGAWYEAADLSTMFADSGSAEMLVPATADSTVGLRLDKSKNPLKGADATPVSSAPGWAINSPNVTVISRGFRFTNAAALNAAAIPPLVPLVNGGVYEAQFGIENYVDGGARINMYANAQYARTNGDTIASNGIYTYHLRLVGATSTNQLLRIQAVNGPIITLDIVNFTSRRMNGDHGLQETALSRPLLKTDGSIYWIDFDGVDDSLVTTFPIAPGAACTVARGIPGVGAQILTAQNITTTFTDNVDSTALIIVNRALTPEETAEVTAYLNNLSGV